MLSFLIHVEGRCLYLDAVWQHSKRLCTRPGPRVKKLCEVIRENKLLHEEEQEVFPQLHFHLLFPEEIIFFYMIYNSLEN